MDLEKEMIALYTWAISEGETHEFANAAAVKYHKELVRAKVLGIIASYKEKDA